MCFPYSKQNRGKSDTIEYELLLNNLKQMMQLDGLPFAKNTDTLHNCMARSPSIMAIEVEGISSGQIATLSSQRLYKHMCMVRFSTLIVHSSPWHQMRANRLQHLGWRQPPYPSTIWCTSSSCCATTSTLTHSAGFIMGLNKCCHPVLGWRDMVFGKRNIVECLVATTFQRFRVDVWPAATSAYGVDDCNSH